MTFEIQKRQGLIVWLYSFKQIKQLRRFGFIHYTSKKMKYAVIYVNQEIIEETIEKLKKLHFVRFVEVSYRPMVDMNFSDRIGKEKLESSSKNEDYVIEQTASL